MIFSNLLNYKAAITQRGGRSDFSSSACCCPMYATCSTRQCSRSDPLTFGVHNRCKLPSPPRPPDFSPAARGVDKYAPFAGVKNILASLEIISLSAPAVSHHLISAKMREKIQASCGRRRWRRRRPPRIDGGPLVLCTASLAAREN